MKYLALNSLFRDRRTLLVLVSACAGMLFAACAVERPGSYGPGPRAEAVRAVESLRQRDDSMLGVIQLNQGMLAAATVADSFVHYDLPLPSVRRLAHSKKFDDIPVNAYTVTYTLKSRFNDSIYASIMLQKLKNKNRWVVTQFGAVNMARALDSTRRRLASATGRKDGFYVVMAPYLDRSFIATGSGNQARMLEVELGDPVWTPKQPLSGQEVFRFLRTEADSLQIGCPNNPEDCRMDPHKREPKRK